MLKLDLILRQKFNISTKMIHSLEILTMTYAELDKNLQKESQENVILDYKSKLEDPSFIDCFKNNNSVSTNYNLSEDTNIIESNPSQNSLQDYLLLQLRETAANQTIKELIEHLIYLIDEDGYLSESLEEISRHLNADMDLLIRAQEILTSFDPLGIGSSSLKQCLLAQTPPSETQLQRLIENHLDNLANSDIEDIQESLKINDEEYTILLEKLKKLNPKPANSFISSQPISYIIPDIIIDYRDNNLSIEFNKFDNISLNQEYISLLENEIDEETKSFLKNNLARSLFFIKALEKRNRTIEDISRYIIEYQKDSIISGLPLKALNMEDIASNLGISISTVSRTIKNKYVQTPTKAYPLKNLLCQSVQKDGVSKDYVKELIKTLIDTENKSKPLSDEKIKTRLNNIGITIQRRTIQKYREEIGFLPSFKRK